MEASPKTNTTPEATGGGQSEFSEKPVEIKSLTPHQRFLLKAVADDYVKHDFFKGLSSTPRTTFYHWIDMMGKPGGLEMLDVSGIEFWRMEAVPNQKKKEKQRFLEFTYVFVIPGTKTEMKLTKEWKYEDFPA